MLTKKTLTSENERVLTPGGMRPKSVVHHVEPGQTVVGSVEGASDAGPAGTRPPSEPAEGRGSRIGSAPAVTGGSGAEAVGEELVLTPGGYRRRSLVHYIEPGHFLDLAGGNIRKMQVSGREVMNFGTLPIRPGGEPLMPRNVALHPRLKPALGSGWIAYASWANNTGHPISRFSTVWAVPLAPASDHGQTIFLFNGIQNSTMIYQPVLQWGPSAAGGGSYWSVASWYVDGQGGQAFHSNLVRVNTNDALIGVMTLTGQVGNQFSYTCEFSGVANTSLPITNVQELTSACETLEAYGVQQCSDYPNATSIKFAAADITAGGTSPGIAWSAVNAVTDCGQSMHVMSDANPGGEVDLYFSKWIYDLNVLKTHAKNGSQMAWAFLSDAGGASNEWLLVRPAAADGVANVFAVLCNALAKGRKVDVLLDEGQISQATLK